MATAKKAPAEQITAKKVVPAKKAAPAKKATAVKVAAPEAVAPKAVPAKKAAAPKAAAAKVAAKLNPEAAPAKKAASKKLAPAEAVQAPTPEVKKRTPNAAFMRALSLSPALAAVVGAKSLPRTEIVSKLWAYIKENQLQDSVNRRMINADAKLKVVFEKAQVSMFEIAGLIGKHAK